VTAGEGRLIRNKERLLRMMRTGCKDAEASNQEGKKAGVDEGLRTGLSSFRFMILGAN